MNHQLRLKGRDLTTDTAGLCRIILGVLSNKENSFSWSEKNQLARELEAVLYKVVQLELDFDIREIERARENPESSWWLRRRVLYEVLVSDFEAQELIARLRQPGQLLIKDLLTGSPYADVSVEIQGPVFVNYEGPDLVRVRAFLFGDGLAEPQSSSSNGAGLS